MLKTDRIGLILVLESLAAIATIAYMVVGYQNENRLENTRQQGVSLVRAVSAIPYEQLLPQGSQAGVLRVLQHGTRADDFAYVSIVDADNNVVNEWAADGVIVPQVDIDHEPSSWLGESLRQLPASGREVLEFHAPLLSDGELQGFVRLGFRSTKVGFDTERKSRHA